MAAAMRNRTTPDDLDKVRQGIDELVRRVSANPLTYFGEADLQSEFFAILLEHFGGDGVVGNVFGWGSDNPKTIMPCLTRRLHSELALPEGRIDIAVLELSKIRVGIGPGGRFSYVQLDSGNHIFVEMKASRTNRSSMSSKNRWRGLIRSDIQRLSAYPHQGIVLCFDFSKILGSDEILELVESAPENIEVRYVQEPRGDRYLAQT